MWLMSSCDIWSCFILFCHLTACRKDFIWSVLFNSHIISAQNHNMKVDNNKFMRKKCCSLWFCYYQMKYEIKNSNITNNVINFFYVIINNIIQQFWIISDKAVNSTMSQTENSLDVIIRNLKWVECWFNFKLISEMIIFRRND